MLHKDSVIFRPTIFFHPKVVFFSDIFHDFVLPSPAPKHPKVVSLYCHNVICCESLPHCFSLIVVDELTIFPLQISPRVALFSAIIRGIRQVIRFSFRLCQICFVKLLSALGDKEYETSWSLSWIWFRWWALLVKTAFDNADSRTNTGMCLCHYKDFTLLLITLPSPA